MRRLFKRRVQLPPKPVESPVYDSCAVLTLDRFERCLLKEEFTALLKEGHTATPDVLKATWDKIWLEYVDLSGDPDFINYRGKKAEEQQRQIKISRVEDTLKILWTFCYPPLIEQLRAWGYTEGEYPLDPTNVEDYRRNLDMIATSLGHDDERLEQLRKEMQNYQQRQSGGSMHEKYFTRLLLEIEEMQGVRMNKETITVKEFTVYLDKLRDKYKAMEAKHRK